jgi:hypothetical protein
MTRKYSSISVETTLASSINTTATSMTVATGTAAALMGGVSLGAGDVDIFTVAIDVDTINEEIVYVTNVSGDILTISRGRAGTGTPGVSGIAHSSGATVKHVLTSDDLTDFESAVSPIVSLGFSGSTSGTTTLQSSAIASGTVTIPSGNGTLATIAGTQILTNKTINYNDNTITNLPNANFDLSINAQTGTTYTLVLGDKNKLITLSNSSAITLTVPTNTSVAFPTGSQINLSQNAIGQVTIVGDTGVTINATPGLKLRDQYSSATLVKIGTNSWLLMGDLST